MTGIFEIKRGSTNLCETLSTIVCSNEEVSKGFVDSVRHRTTYDRWNTANRKVPFSKVTFTHRFPSAISEMVRTLEKIFGLGSQLTFPKSAIAIPLRSWTITFRNYCLDHPAIL